MFTIKCLTRLYTLSNNCKCSINRHVYYNLKLSYTIPQNDDTKHGIMSRLFTTSLSNSSISVNNEQISEAFVNLESNHKNQQRIYRKEIELLIKDTKAKNEITENNILLLLQCCGHLMPDELPSKRIALAQEAWKILINNNLPLNVHHYNALLQCYVENKMILSYKEFLANMTCKPDEQTYNLLLEIVCQNGDMRQAVGIVNVIKEKGLSANEPVFNLLILGHLHSGDFKSAQNILDTMRIAQITPTSKTYTALLRGSVSDTNQFTYFLRNVNREFNSKQLISVLHSICLAENVALLPLVKKAYSFVIEESRLFETQLINLCTQFVHLKKALIAYQLLKHFMEVPDGFISESGTYATFLLYEMIRSKTPAETIIKIADDLIKTERNTFALIKASEISLRIPDVDLSLTLLQTLFDRKMELRTHFFWPLLVCQGKLHGEKGIFNIFDIMLKYNVKIDNESLEMYSLQYVKNIDPQLLINRLKDFNLTVAEVLTPLCVILLRSGNLTDVSDILPRYNVKVQGNKLIKSLTSAFIATKDAENVVNILKNILSKDSREDLAGQLISLFFMKSLKDLLDFQLLINLLKIYRKNEIKITAPYMDRIEYYTRRIADKDTRQKLLNALFSLEAKNGTENREYIAHPRNMNLEELECHLIELREKSMDTRGVLRKLIQMHCRVGNVDRVRKLCQEFEDAGYNMTPGMKSGLLDVYLKTEQFSEAWKVYKEIKEHFPSFTVDEFKVVDLARLLHDNDKFKDAVNILKNESSNRKIRGGNVIERNCWKLLDSVARTGNIAETKEMFETLVSSGYCIESNIILGPLIRVHLCNDEFSQAVDEYVNCCIKHNRTPLSHELLCLLVKEETDTDLIQKVVEATTLVHGLSNSQMTLVAALAETGHTKTLRKVFIDLKSNLPQILLEQYCERWIKEGKIDALKNLLISSRRITKVDVTPVYLYLMRVYSANNDCDSALVLWNEMQDNNVIPSDKIKSVIRSLLKNQQHPMAEKL